MQNLYINDKLRSKNIKIVKKGDNIGFKHFDKKLLHKN